MGQRGEPTVATAEVDDPPGRDEFDQREQIVEWLVTLGLEPPVLSGVPAVGFAGRARLDYRSVRLSGGGGGSAVCSPINSKSWFRNMSGS